MFILIETEKSMQSYWTLNLDSWRINRRSVQKIPSHVIWIIETFNEEDIRNIVPRTMILQSPFKWAPWGLTQFSQSLSASLSHFPDFTDCLKSLPFQRWFYFWENPEVTWHQVWAIGGWVTWVIWGFDKKIQETWCMSRSVVVMKLPIAVAIWIILIVSAEDYSSLMQNLM